jgi:hypothetical protein
VIDVFDGTACSCSPFCELSGDCCFDARQVCPGAESAPDLTCAGRCDQLRHDPDGTFVCACTPDCVSNGDCCRDYGEVCAAPL